MIENSIHSDSSSQSLFSLTTKRVCTVLSFLIALFLILTGILKVFSPTALINTSRELFPWAGNTIHSIIGSLMPVLELGLGILLMLRWKHKEVLIATSVLFGLFLTISIYGQATGVNADCGCFGGIITSSFGWGMLTRNGILFLCAVFLISNSEKGWCH